MLTPYYVGTGFREYVDVPLYHCGPAALQDIQPPQVSPRSMLWLFTHLRGQPIVSLGRGEASLGTDTKGEKQEL